MNVNGDIMSKSIEKLDKLTTKFGEWTITVKKDSRENTILVIQSEDMRLTFFHDGGATYASADDETSRL